MSLQLSNLFKHGYCMKLKHVPDDTSFIQHPRKKIHHGCCRATCLVRLLCDHANKHTAQPLLKDCPSETEGPDCRAMKLLWLRWPY